MGGSNKTETEYLSQTVNNVTKAIELDEKRRIQREKDEAEIVKEFDEMLAFVNSNASIDIQTREKVKIKPSTITKAEKIISLAKEETKALFRKYKDLVFWAIRHVPEDRELIEMLAEKYFSHWLTGYAEVYNIAEMVRLVFELSQAGMNPIMSEAVARLLRNPAIEKLFNDQRKRFDILGKAATKKESLPEKTQVPEIA